MVLKLGIWMYPNNLEKKSSEEEVYSSVYIPVSGYPEVYTGSLSNIFFIADIDFSNVIFIHLNSELLLCVNESYLFFNDNINYIATSLQRSYTKSYEINHVIHGPALLFGQKFDQTKNNEKIDSIQNKYIEELFLRAFFYEKNKF